MIAEYECGHKIRVRGSIRKGSKSGEQPLPHCPRCIRKGLERKLVKEVR